MLQCNAAMSLAWTTTAGMPPRSAACRVHEKKLFKINILELFSRPLAPLARALLLPWQANDGF